MDAHVWDGVYSPDFQGFLGSVMLKTLKDPVKVRGSKILKYTLGNYKNGTDKWDYKEKDSELIKSMKNGKGLLSDILMWLTFDL